MTDRAQRPQPNRTRPKRDPNDVLRGFAMRPQPGEPAKDPITHSVGVGYRIIEQYLEQSRAVAEGIAPKSASAGGNVLGDLTSRLMRTTADMFEVWFQVLDVTGAARAAGTAAPGASEPAPAQAAASGAPAASAASVSVRLESSRPASVAVDLRPYASEAPLAAHALRSEDEALPRISGVRITPSVDGAPVSVVVTIPPDQPAGVYNGLIVDTASSLPVGTISVRLDAPGCAD